jgi:hypothetical protein
MQAWTRLDTTEGGAAQSDASTMMNLPSCFIADAVRIVVSPDQER